MIEIIITTLLIFIGLYLMFETWYLPWQLNKPELVKPIRKRACGVCGIGKEGSCCSEKYK